MVVWYAKHLQNPEIARVHPNVLRTVKQELGPHGANAMQLAMEAHKIRSGK